MKLSIALLYLFVTIRCYPQSKFVGESPVVGQLCPDYELTNIKFFSKKSASIHDFKGKWLVLDFWNTSCTSCIKSFPYTNRLMEKYGEKVQFILVGDDQDEKKAQALFAKFREKENLKLPCSFDNKIGRKFDFNSFPQVIVIDDKGIIRSLDIGITGPQIDDLMSNRVKNINSNVTFKFDRNKPLLVNGNGGNDTDFVFRSVITDWRRDQEQYYLSEITPEVAASGMLQESGVPLQALYMMAYFGRKWNPGGNTSDGTYSQIFKTPILKLKDNSLFAGSFIRAENYFSYSIILPKKISTKEKLLNCLQSDLASYFGYAAKIEVLDCPYLALVANDHAKTALRTKGGKYSMTGKYADFRGTNIRMLHILSWLDNMYQDQIFVDETGIKTNIDLSLDCIVTDLEDVKRALRMNGLDLVIKTKPMKALVIRDSVIETLKAN